MSNVTGESLLETKIGIVLGRRRLKHRRTKVGGIAEVLRKCIVSQERPAAREAPANIYVARLVPTLRRILQQVDSTNRKRCVRHGDVGRQGHTRQEAEHLERPARSDCSWAGSSVVNQMRALQVHSV